MNAEVGHDSNIYRRTSNVLSDEMSRLTPVVNLVGEVGNGCRCLIAINGHRSGFVHYLSPCAVTDKTVVDRVSTDLPIKSLPACHIRNIESASVREKFR